MLWNLKTDIDDEWYVVQIEDVEGNISYSNKYYDMKSALESLEGYRKQGYKSAKLFWNLEISKEIQV